MNPSVIDAYLYLFLKDKMGSCSKYQTRLLIFSYSVSVFRGFFIIFNINTQKTAYYRYFSEKAKPD